MKPSTATLAFVLCALADAALGEDFLRPLDGRWTGTGWIQPASEGVREALRCRLAVTTHQAPERADLNGLCATAGRRFDLKGFIAREAGENYRGLWHNPTGEGAVRLSGKADGKAVVFTYRGREPETGRRVRGTMTWRFLAEGFSITTTVTDATGGAAWRASTISFAR